MAVGRRLSRLSCVLFEGSNVAGGALRKGERCHMPYLCELNEAGTGYILTPVESEWTIRIGAMGAYVGTNQLGEDAFLSEHCPACAAVRFPLYHGGTVANFDEVFSQGDPWCQRFHAERGLHRNEALYGP